MKNRILSLILSLILFFEATPLMGMQCSAAEIGVAPGVEYNGATKQVTATAGSGSLFAGSYNSEGRQLKVKTWTVNGEKQVNVSDLFTPETESVRLFLMDDEGVPLSNVQIMEETGGSLQIGRTEKILTAENSTVLGDGIIVETGGAFPDGSSLVLEKQTSPTPLTVEAQEITSPDETDHPTVITCTIRDKVSINAFDPSGNPIQPRNSDGEPETVCIRMSTSYLTEQEQENICPMYFDEILNQWLEPETYYLDREAKELVILTNHFSIWGRFSKKEKQDIPGRYDRYTWKDWSPVNMSSLPKDVTKKMMALYDQHKKETSYGWLADGLSAMNDVTGSPVFD